MLSQSGRAIDLGPYFRLDDLSSNETTTEIASIYHFIPTRKLNHGFRIMQIASYSQIRKNVRSSDIFWAES